MHLTLNQMALADPALAWATEGTAINDEPAFQRRRMEVYCLMWLRYLQFGHSLGVFPTGFVRGVLAEVFSNEPGREAWRRVGASIQFADTPASSDEFRKIVSEEFARMDPPAE